jgi:hypothetical protein
MPYYRVSVRANVERTSEYILAAKDGDTAVELVKKLAATNAGSQESETAARTGFWEEQTLQCSHTPSTETDYMNSDRV